jgi:hypothetical protein
MLTQCDILSTKKVKNVHWPGKGPELIWLGVMAGLKGYFRQPEF